MALLGTTRTGDTAVSAHPVTGHPHVDVPVLLLVVAAAILVAMVAVLAPARQTSPGGPGPSGTESWPGSLSRPEWLVRTLAVLLLALAVVAGRFGADDELDNLAPSLVVGAGLPLLVVGSLVVGRLWRWVDPWDTVARVLTPREVSAPPGHVWPAVVTALPLLWFLSVHARPLDPRAVGAAVAAYSAVTVAGCVALGRARWLASAEPIGLVLSWIGLVPQGQLARWQPPRGAGVLLGVLVGGLLFGVVRRTELWVPVLTHPRAVLWSTVGLLAACALGAALVTAAGAVSTTAHPRALVARAMVPAVAGVLIAVALSRNRFFTSVQLLPGVLGDPLGRGWDVLGDPTVRLVAAPVGAAGLVGLQLGVVVALHGWSAVVASRDHDGDERLPAIVALSLSVAAAVVALSVH